MYHTGVLYLGAHLSAAGGVSRAAAAAVACGCQALQLFLRPPGRWQGGTLEAAEIARFRALATAGGLAGRCFAHAPYLLNLASADDTLRQRSLAVLAEELRAADALGLSGVVLHPGSAGDAARGEAIPRCRDAIAEALARAGAGSAKLLLEGTAGAGHQLGATPAELATLVPEGAAERIGVCLDTAHLWAAGYHLEGDGWDEVLAELATHWGRVAPDLIHGNDSPVACGSRRDRHAVPGEGQLGEAVFRKILGDPRLEGVPMVLEIPPGARNATVLRALAQLRKWTRAPAPAGPTGWRGRRRGRSAQAGSSSRR
jgi:deoxyribonuclease-4